MSFCHLCIDLSMYLSICLSTCLSFFYLSIISTHLTSIYLFIILRNEYKLMTFVQCKLCTELNITNSILLGSFKPRQLKVFKFQVHSNQIMPVWFKTEGPKEQDGLVGRLWQLTLLTHIWQPMLTMSSIFLPLSPLSHGGAQSLYLGFSCSRFPDCTAAQLL